MEKIKQIVEAYSMQPRYWYVAEKENGMFCCKEIKLEKLSFDTNEDLHEEGLYYVGYNFEGKKIFQCLRNSVNVEFDTEVKND